MLLVWLIFYAYYVAPLKDIYFAYNNDKPNGDDLTYQLLDYADYAHESFDLIFGNGLNEPSGLSLSFRTAPDILQQEIRHEFAAAQLSEKEK